MAVNKNNVKIHVEHLKKNFGNLEVLRDVSTDIYEGEVVVILGPSGSGKSTFLRCLNRLEEITGGTVIVDGHDLTDKKTDLNKVRENVGMVFQHFNLFPHLTIRRNITIAPVKNKILTQAQADKRADELLAMVGLSDKAEAYPSQLSGGQKQRIAIAGILAMQPSVIIADESTAMLDPSGRQEVLSTIRRLNREKGITVVWITHFMEEAAQADRIIVMNQGEVALSGTPREVFPQVDTLRELHLDVPHMTALSDSLRRDGMPLPGNILTVDEMTKEVLTLLCPSK